MVRAKILACMVQFGSELLRVAWDFDSPRITGSSVCGVCETYYISTRCEPLYPKCNRISSNKNMKMTPYSPIHRRLHHCVDCQRTRMTQMTKDFAKHHDENYVEWNGISIKSHQFVTNCPYQTMYSKHKICSYEFLLRFHDSLSGRLCNQIRTTFFLHCIQWFCTIALYFSLSVLVCL